jgi:N-carbamoyl-L-amino-acid hydrolase
MVIGSSLRINEERFRENFEKLATIGATDDGGVNRLTFTKSHTKAREWFLETGREAGFEGSVDGAANHSVVHRSPTAKKTLLMGSHLDSVPNGGRFDGALGVLAALEVLNSIKDADLQLPVHLEAIDFTDEESTYVEFLGSRAFIGQLTENNLQVRDGNQAAFDTILESMDLSRTQLFTCGRDPKDFVGYLELHIEQGSRLVDQNINLGIVTGIVGIMFERTIFHGHANHAGTTPMTARRNAGLGASAFNLAVDRLVKDDFPDCVANVGNMIFLPGASNVVPERVEVTTEYRAPDDILGKELADAVHKTAIAEAKRHNLELEIIPVGQTNAILMDAHIQETINASTEILGMKATKMASGAAHDAQILANFTPAGMIFVPSAGGISHNPNEYTPWEDCVNGANALLHAAILWAQQTS